MHVTSSNQPSNEAIKNLRPSLTRRRYFFSVFYGISHQTIMNLNVDFAWKLQDHYQIVRKLSISPNWSTGSLPEVKVRKVKLTFSDESTYKCWCFLSYLILFIISGITWLSLKHPKLILLIKIIKMGSKSRNKKNKKTVGGHRKIMSIGNGL